MDYPRFDLVRLDRPTLDLPELDPDKVRYIIVHCTDTSATNTLTIEDLDNWHRARGFKCCGYHFVVMPDGRVLEGRSIFSQGAHALLYNDRSIGVAYVGGRNRAGAIADTRTYAQKISMAYLFARICDYYPKIDEIIGHNDVSTKWCPCFNAKAEYANFISKLKSL